MSVESMDDQELEAWDRRQSLFNIFYDRGRKPRKEKDPERLLPLMGCCALAAASIGMIIMFGAPFVAPYLVGK